MLCEGKCGPWSGALARCGGFQKTAWFDWACSKRSRWKADGPLALPAPRNVLVDELIAEAEFRQVPEPSYQVDVFVAGVALPSTSVAHWDHRPVFAKGPLC